MTTSSRGISELAPDERRRRTLGESHADCFACGLGNPYGLRLDFRTGDEGVVWADWMPAGHHTGYHGQVHGGLIATLADSAMVHALATRGVAGVTAEMNLRYRHPVAPGRPLAVRGEVARSRHGIHYCVAELGQDGRVVVRANAKFMEIRDPNG